MPKCSAGAGPMPEVPGGAGREDICMFVSSREAKRRRGSEPRVDHWCRLGPEWRTAPLRRGRQNQSNRSTRHRIQLAAAYDVRLFYTRQRIRSLKVRCEKVGRDWRSSADGCLVFQGNRTPRLGGGALVQFHFIFIFKSQFGKCMKNQRNSAS